VAARRLTADEESYRQPTLDGRCSARARQTTEEGSMLGLDGSKAWLSFSLHEPTSQHRLAYGTVPNTPTGHQQVLAQIPAEHPWVLDPTGRYGEALVATARAAG
jgi:hypothetical protein